MNASTWFGYWEGHWAWRVEYEQSGQPQFRDFRQKDYRPGKALEAAKEFMSALSTEIREAV